MSQHTHTRETNLNQGETHCVLGNEASRVKVLVIAVVIVIVILVVVVVVLLVVERERERDNAHHFACQN